MFRIFLFCFLSIFSLSALSDIYKCVFGDGIVVYGDEYERLEKYPCTEKGLFIKSRPRPINSKNHITKENSSKSTKPKENNILKASYGEINKNTDFDDIQEAINSYQSFEIKKDEFETKEEYKKRKDLLKPKSSWIFVVYDGIKNEYDAEKNIMSISLLNKRSNDFSKNHDYDSLILVSSKKEEEYFASNAFGASINVKKTTSYGYGISSDNIDGFNFKIYIERDYAKKFKNKIVVVVFCESIPYKNDYLFSYFSKSEPKITHPYESIYFDRFLNVNIKSAWLYNVETREILAKKGKT